MNLSLNELKRRKRRRERISRRPVEEFYNLEAKGEGAGARDTREMVHRAIDQLDDKFRPVIVLRLIDGYSTDETAKILNVPVGTVLSRLARAQEKLKTILISEERG
jgi:RNA polymerase sigma-70 factor (ECF subfamily)